MIDERVKSGLGRARAEGCIGGRPRIDPDKEERIKVELRQSTGILKVAKKLGVGHGTVARIKASLS